MQYIAKCSGTKEIFNTEIVLCLVLIKSQVLLKAMCV